MNDAFAQVATSAAFVKPPIPVGSPIHHPVEFREEEINLSDPLPSVVQLLKNGGRLLVIIVLREMPYEEYLRTNHWQTIRERTLRLANYRCQICLSPTRLDVHHIRYARRGDEPPEDVIALCGGPDGCHKKQHSTLAMVARAEGEARFRE